MTQVDAQSPLNGPKQSVELVNDVRKPSRARPLVRNVLLNFGGIIAPLCAAAVSLPILARYLDAERLGILNLAWILLGSFSLLDLGLGRAITHAVAATVASDEADGLPNVVAAAWAALFVFGSLAGLTLATLAPWLSSEVFRVSGATRADMILSLYILACALPFMTTGSGVRGVLEGTQRFDLVNLVRTPLGIVSYLGPAMVVPFSESPVILVGVLAVARMTALVAYIALSHRLLPVIGRASHFGVRPFQRLVGMGGWITVANVAGTLMAYLDRMVLGSTSSLAVLSYYATPQELVTKITIVPVAFSAVMFPAFSAASASGSPSLSKLLGKMSLYVLMALLPFTIVGAAFARELLGFWLGPRFASNSAIVVQWLCLGVLANSVAVAPVVFLQAVGRADVAAKIQCLELPVYCAALWWAARRHGINGVAVVWAVRMIASALVMFVASHRSVRGVARWYRSLTVISAAALTTFAMIISCESLAAKAAVCTMALGAFALAVPHVIADEDRSYAFDAWRRLRGRQT